MNSLAVVFWFLGFCLVPHWPQRVMVSLGSQSRGFLQLIKITVSDALLLALHNLSLLILHCLIGILVYTT